MSQPQAAAESVEILTPPGRGAVAVVRCTGSIALLDAADGSRVLCRARDGRPFAGRAVNRITFARWGAEHPEDVVVCRTAEQEFEIHCHGGRAAVERIQQELSLAADAASVSGQSSSTTLAASSTSVLLAAAWEAVTRATTLRTADLLLNQAAEAWPAAIAHVQGGNVPRSPEVRAWAAHALQWVDFGRHLTEPWTVAIVGQPNAGKSSLMNALAGFQRSIVNPTAGTTRDAVSLDVAFDGWPVRLIDTAGLRDAADELESAGIERARRVIADADLVLQVFDATGSQPTAIDRALRVANKVDLTPNSIWPDNITAVSALTGVGIDQLIERITSTLIPDLLQRELAIPVCAEHLAWLRSQYPAVT